MGRFLVTLQFIAIGLLFGMGWRGLLEDKWLLLPVFFGFGLVAHAIAVMGTSNLRTVPEPAASATLCSKGAYRWIRHPMYLAVMLCAIPFAWVSSAPLFSGVVCLLLAAVLFAKMRIEERLWMHRDPELFGPYLASTKKLIPFLY